MGVNQYKAFISYSHKDRAWAKWLHRKLERYTFPENLIGSQTEIGPIPRNLKPIFRDREELAAGHNLGEKIEAALKASENLIIICSPNAAQSYWVNQEVLYFKRNNRGAKIFSVIVEGEPFASSPDEECFPDALKFEINQSGELSSTAAEPLAADLRSNGDGKRLGLLKLISGLAGLGVNDLVQRDLQRARRRVTAITVSAAAIVLAMGGLTWTALDARNEAEQRRNDAEGQIEFMLTDLKDKLEGVGRLDALQVVGDKAASYYEAYDLSDHDDDALGRRARVFHYLGEIQDKLGKLDEAESYFQRAYAATEYLLERDPDNTDRIFEHAQSAYWVGYVPYSQGDYKGAELHFTKYQNLAKTLVTIESENLTWQLENAHAFTNLGSLKLHTGEPQDAINYFSKAIPGFKINAEAKADDFYALLDLANAYSWLGNSYFRYSHLQKARKMHEKQLKIYDKMLEIDPRDSRTKLDVALAYYLLSHISYLEGRPSEADLYLDQYGNLITELESIDSENILYAEEKVKYHLRKLEISFEYKDNKQFSENLLNLKRVFNDISKTERHTRHFINHYQYLTNIMEAQRLIDRDQTKQAISLLRPIHTFLLEHDKPLPPNELELLYKLMPVLAQIENEDMSLSLEKPLIDGSASKIKNTRTRNLIALLPAVNYRNQDVLVSQIMAELKHRGMSENLIIKKITPKLGE